MTNVLTRVHNPSARALNLDVSARLLCLHHLGLHTQDAYFRNILEDVESATEFVNLMRIYIDIREDDLYALMSVYETQGVAAAVDYFDVLLDSFELDWASMVS